VTPAEQAVRAAIARRGPIPLDEVVEIALYHPHVGFYATGGRAGREGDFLTSPEVGPLFGAVVARSLDGWWIEAGRPDAFAVVEVGAGPGTLARTILAAKPACAPALRYVLVERSAAQRARHAEGLSLEDPAAAFASPLEPTDDREPTSAMMPSGPIVVSLAELPRLPGPTVVLANELLDNLPFRLLQRTDTGWAEVRLGLDGDGLAEVLVPVAAAGLPAAEPGARVPVSAAITDWVRDAVALAGPGGRVVAFDYVASSVDLASRPWTEWVRTYRQHDRGSMPFEALGTQDITCEVAVDQIVPAPIVSTQADWLRRQGIDDLVAEGRRIWQERAAIGDLAAIRARSRITEAEALLDPTGLGAFHVLEWPGR
jgi:SAM-dependent MidA family methyltransferase